MKKLPVGIQTFAEIIAENYLYVDRTQHIAELIDSGKYLFLCRPRRFGKSVLVSTLAEIFAGNQALFEGLAIYDQLDWQAYPVLKIDFSAISCEDEEILKTSLLAFLDKIAARYAVKFNSPPFVKDRFAELIEKIYEKKQQKVVILVDEYDSPIITHVHDIERANKNRAVLRSFFTVLKFSDPYIKFTFLTGISKFSRVSIFSELNNLRDLTLSPQYATLVGYTQAELEHYFAEHIEQCCAHLGLTQAALLARVKAWYNGYSWDAQNQVYNPFSILCFFAERQFGNYWFASGTPTFLMTLIKQKRYDVTTFEHQVIPEIVFESYNIESMDIHALLFQTGYLTITQIDKDRDFVIGDSIEYTLSYPNQEVKQAFVTFLMQAFTDSTLDKIQPAAKRLRQALQTQDMDTL